jgi:Na+/proline symporter
VSSGLCWCGAGNTVAVILQVNVPLSIIVSAAIVIFYTFLGGLYAVAYTDVIQFFCIAGGLVSISFHFISILSVHSRHIRKQTQHDHQQQKKSNFNNSTLYGDYFLQHSA